MKRFASMAFALCAFAAEASAEIHAPKLLFKAGFDGTAQASVAAGAAAPVTPMENLRFVPGVKGQALSFVPGVDAVLAYAAQDNLVPERGALAFWFKPAKGSLDRAGGYEQRCFFCTDPCTPRAGSGQLWFFRYGRMLRADVSDDADSHVLSSRPMADDWNHFVINWSEAGCEIYLNGEPITRRRRNAAAIFAAAKKRFPLPPAGKGRGLSFSRRHAPERFFVGTKAGTSRMDGAMDELEIWSRPFSSEEVRAHIAASRIPLPQTKTCVRAKRFVQEGPNPCLADPCGAGGVIPDLELVERVAFDAVPTNANRFVSRGALRIGELNGVKFLEAGRKAEDRWAYRFVLPDDQAPLYVFEVDYPDDTKRTMDIVVQGSQETRWDGARGADYILQMGIACGDEYPNTGRILTDRYVYWRRGRDVTLSTMTCRGEAPAAISEIRLYRVKSGRLPAADIHEPPANEEGWHRTFACYFEDVSVGYNFAVDGDGGDERSIGPMLDRLIATMKFTGQNVFCYPGCWYDGLMGEGYLPRSHLLDYRRAYLDKFDRAGIGYMPTINQFNLPMSAEELAAAPGTDGTCHDSPLTIMANGRISTGAFHGQPTSYNVLHPSVRKDILHSVDTFIAEGRDHPSFKGIVLHLTRNSLLWFGNETGGYNDYAIDGFRESLRGLKGVEGLAAIDRKDPFRGKKYYEAIAADPELFARWIDWRCERVAAFYREIAARLAAARPDLKLVINSFLLPDWRHRDFTQEDFLETANRRAGLDVRKLADLKNVSFCQSEMPADYRSFGPFDPTNPKDGGLWGGFAATAAPTYRVMYSRKGDFGSIYPSSYPWVNQHDRYWESHTAATKENCCHGIYYRDDKHGPMRAPWLKECPWRVSTVNPSGRDALRAYALPMRHTDVLAVSKGGFLIGTYGTEDVLVPWIRAFRALPAVKMTDCGGDEVVRIRTVDFNGRTYFSVVNTENAARSIAFAFPEGTQDLVTGEKLAGPCRLTLDAYELRSFIR